MQWSLAIAGSDMGAIAVVGWTCVVVIALQWGRLQRHIREGMTVSEGEARFYNFCAGVMVALMVVAVAWVVFG